MVVDPNDKVMTSREIIEVLIKLDPNMPNDTIWEKTLILVAREKRKKEKE